MPQKSKKHNPEGSKRLASLNGRPETFAVYSFQMGTIINLQVFSDSEWSAITPEKQQLYTLVKGGYASSEEAISAHQSPGTVSAAKRRPQRRGE